MPYQLTNVPPSKSIELKEIPQEHSQSTDHLIQHQNGFFVSKERRKSLNGSFFISQEECIISLYHEKTVADLGKAMIMIEGFRPHLILEYELSINTIKQIVDFCVTSREENYLANRQYQALSYKKVSLEEARRFEARLLAQGIFFKKTSNNPLFFSADKGQKISSYSWTLARFAEI